VICLGQPPCGGCDACLDAAGLAPRRCDRCGLEALPGDTLCLACGVQLAIDCAPGLDALPVRALRTALRRGAERTRGALPWESAFVPAGACS
jgi:hypothetical protein